MIIWKIGFTLHFGIISLSSIWVHSHVTRENKRRKVSVVGQKTVTIINTGAAFMGARDWDEETSINL